MNRSVALLPVFLVACGGSPPPPSVAPEPSAAPSASAASTPAPVAAPSASAAPPVAPPPAEEPKVVTRVTVPPAIAAIVAAGDRSGEDKKLDAGRHPGETLSFIGVAPGMRVGEIAAAAGYTTELLERAVAPNGTVYGENPKLMLEKYAEKPWTARLAKPVNKHIVRVDRELGDPFPPDATDLDAVVDVLFYHDTVWLGVDRDAMNRAIFKALKPGGVYVVIDHSAKEGSGVNDVKTLHRIEERTVREEVTRAGFRLDSVATYLANPSDSRDWNDSPIASAAKRGTSDRFVLKFVKP